MENGIKIALLRLKLLHPDLKEIWAMSVRRKRKTNFQQKCGELVLPADAQPRGEGEGELPSCPT